MGDNMRILVIEDEYNLADVIASRLRKENYAVDIACDGEEGIDNAMSNIYDLIILDVMLPKMNGFEILQKIRKKQLNVKIIMLTARTLLEDKLKGLNNGANDYLTKPFHIEELVARVNIQLKKDHKETIKDYIEVGDLRLNTKTTNLICTTTNESIDIVCKEFLLLEYLMQNPEQTIPKDKIYEKVWGFDSDAESNNLEVYLSFVRKKIKIIGSTIKIKSIRGLGYRLEARDEKIK